MAKGITASLNYAWRVVATAISFSVFGLGGILIGLIALPLLCLFTKDSQRRSKRAQRLICCSFRLFMRLMHTLGIMSYEVIGAERLHHSRGEIIVANHPSLLDVVLLISHLPRADCIVKQTLWQNPFTRGPVKAANYILNNESEALIDECIKRLSASDTSLVIFPEGTRTRADALLNKFQRGAAHIALESRTRLIPVVIDCYPTTLTKNEAWYRIPSRPFHLRAVVKPAIDPQAWIAKTQASPMQARQLTDYLQLFFENEIQHERIAHRS